MIRHKFGSIANPETKETMDIVGSAISKKNLRDMMIGGSIAMVGIFYTMLAAFRNGAEAFDSAEYKVLEELKLFSDSNLPGDK